MGRQSEGLRKNTEEQVDGRCFSIFFKSRRKNLDLIASSEEEAKQWVNSLQKIVSSINNLSSQQKAEQYPYHDSSGFFCEPDWFTKLVSKVPVRWMINYFYMYVSTPYIKNFSAGSSAA